MTNWLSKKDEYYPPKDRDLFIDKSILSVLTMMSGIRWAGKPENGVYYRINATLKFIFTFVLILLLSLSQSFQFILLCDCFIILTMGMLDAGDIKRTAIVIFIAGIFASLILLPSALMGNFHNSANLFLKIIGNLAAVNILANSTKWSHLTRSMKVIKLPDIFILVLDITIKYIFILGEYSINMLYALRLRSVGRNDRKHQSIPNLMGALFLKSKEMAELTYSAMECRGFDGRYLSSWKFRMKMEDFIYSGANFLVIALFFCI
ncbi:MAG: energy-coupling factor transporter transmembrane component T [Brevinematales bacterium]|jgi:cobalt/nickel transport system permease protein